MELNRNKSKLYNKAKNSNNNSYQNNLLTDKNNIININSLNFLKNTKNLTNNPENDKIFDITPNQIICTNNNINLISIPNYSNNLILPEISKNKPNKIPSQKTKKYSDKNIEIIPTNLKVKQNLISLPNPKIKEKVSDKSNQIFSQGKIKQNSSVRKFKTNTIKGYLKESSVKTIQLFLDPRSLKNLILTCKKIYNYFISNDDLWYNYYNKRFKIPSSIIKYEENRGKWREIFLKSTKKLFEQNSNQIKNKFLKNFKNNKYQISKDPYNISNLVYNYMKPVFSIEIDGKIYKVKNIFTNKILSHINFFINFDQEFLDFRKVNKINLLLHEKNLGFSDLKIYEIEIKKKKFLNLETEGIKSNICNIFAVNEFILSTFEKNLIFFINISLPICKICEVCFEFLKGIHRKNLLYLDDISGKFGYYDYVLLINIKSWKDIYFTLHVNKLDFKEDNEGYLVYENDSKSKIFFVLFFFWKIFFIKYFVIINNLKIFYEFLFSGL